MLRRKDLRLDPHLVRDGRPCQPTASPPGQLTTRDLGCQRCLRGGLVRRSRRSTLLLTFMTPTRTLEHPMEDIHIRLHRHRRPRTRILPGLCLPARCRCPHIPHLPATALPKPTLATTSVDIRARWMKGRGLPGLYTRLRYIQPHGRMERRLVEYVNDLTLFA